MITMHKAKAVALLWHSRKVKNRMIPLRKLHLLPYGSNAGSDFLKCAINKEKHSKNRGFQSAFRAGNET